MEVHENIICTFCGCNCDDLQVTTENNKVIGVKYACAISSEKYLSCLGERLEEPIVKVNGQPQKVSVDQALDRAAKILAEAKYPLLYGWSNTSCEAAKAGVELAEELGGVLDNTAVVCHGPGLEAVQFVGEPTCTLGQIRHRADLIVYWGCNPTQAHLRHMQRYSAHSKGRYRSGRKERKVVVIDVRKTPTAKMADMFIQVTPGMDIELLTALRMALRDEEFEVGDVAGVPVEKIEELADWLVSCDFGALFFGLGLTHSVGKNENVAAALMLIRELNSRTKFVIMPNRGHHNVTGANKAFAWQTGYPFAVDFSHAYPRYNPGETSSSDLLARGEFDAALVVASDPAAHMPQQATKNLASIPVVLLDPERTVTSLLAEVHIPPAFIGIECEGTTYRMDGVPLVTKKFIEPPPNCLPDYELLKRLLSRVRKLKGVV